MGVVVFWSTYFPLMGDSSSFLKGHHMSSHIIVKYKTQYLEYNFLYSVSFDIPIYPSRKEGVLLSDSRRAALGLILLSYPLSQMELRDAIKHGRSSQVSMVG